MMTCLGERTNHNLPPVLVVAANQQRVREAVRAIEMLNERKCLYVNGPDDLQGMSNLDVILIPGWRLHPKADDIAMMIVAGNFRVLRLADLPLRVAQGGVQRTALDL